MKTIAILLLGATLGAAPLERSVWFHGLVHIGTLNKDIDPQEFWAELDIHNTNRAAVDLTVTARRHTGLLISAVTYTVGAGEKQTIRVDDPSSNVLTADDVQGQKQLRATLLVEPADAGVVIASRQLNLHGNELETTILDEGRPGKALNSRTVYRVEAGSHRTYTLSNIGNATATVLHCEGTDIDAGCNTSATIPTLVTPYATVHGVFPEQPYARYVFFTKPKEVIVQGYDYGTGTFNTFNVKSGITFGATVPEKK
jgi:hypothetical protein